MRFTPVPTGQSHLAFSSFSPSDGGGLGVGACTALRDRGNGESSRTTPTQTPPSAGRGFHRTPPPLPMGERVLKRLQFDIGRDVLRLDAIDRQPGIEPFANLLDTAIVIDPRAGETPVLVGFLCARPCRFWQLDARWQHLEFAERGVLLDAVSPRLTARTTHRRGRTAPRGCNRHAPSKQSASRAKRTGGPRSHAPSRCRRRS